MKTFKKSRTASPIHKPAFMPGLLTMEECCERYGISISLLYKCISARELPFYRFGRRNYFDPEEADEYFKKRCRREAVK
jgi:excisionase family DNA binding protein